MKYDARLYAKALAAALGEKHSPAKEKQFVENLLSLLLKNGDMGQAKKVLREAGKLVRRADGIRKVNIESARPMGAKTFDRIKGSFKKTDVFEEGIRPELVAGVRLLIDDELELDGSLARKLQKLFT